MATSPDALNWIFSRLGVTTSTSESYLTERLDCLDTWYVIAFSMFRADPSSASAAFAASSIAPQTPTSMILERLAFVMSGLSSHKAGRVAARPDQLLTFLKKAARTSQPPLPCRRQRLPS